MIKKRIKYIISVLLFHVLSDENYLKIRYYISFHKKLNLMSPKSFNEKLQWLKLYNRNPKYTEMVDKYEVKQIVSNIIGDDYIIPTYGLYENVDDIDFLSLPKSFVIKCTHDSGSVIICNNKDEINIRKIKRRLSFFLKKNHFFAGREWPYKNVKPRIIIEEYIEDSKYKELRDYKFYCFNGVVKMYFISKGRKDGKPLYDYFDRNGNFIDLRWGKNNSGGKVEKPINLEEMISKAEALSNGIPEVRVDFYEANGKVYFGEMTFFDGCGFERIEPEKWDMILGEWLILPTIK